MKADTERVWTDLAGPAENGNLKPATAADSIPGGVPEKIFEPDSEVGIADALRIAAANGIRVIPRGGGSKPELGNPVRGADLVISTGKLNRVIEHAWADMTATVEAGCTMAAFDRVLAEHGQRLPIDALCPDRATVGGVLATNDTGSFRTRFGGLRDLIIGIKVVLASGTIARSGGKVVKNVAGYDLPKLFTGSLGSLGIITEATFRLYPVAFDSRSLSFKLSNLEEISMLVLRILGSVLCPAGLQVRAGSGTPAMLDVRLEGAAAALDHATERLLTIVAKDPVSKEAENVAEVWKARQLLWDGSVEKPSLVCKFSALPSGLTGLCELVARVAEGGGLDWKLVGQGIGVGLLRLIAEDTEALVPALAAIREGIESRGGSLVVWRMPAALRSRIDAWGEVGDALPLMKRIKERFDPAGVLNPGRFVGGI